MEISMFDLLLMVKQFAIVNEIELIVREHRACAFSVTIKSTGYNIFCNPQMFDKRGDQYTLVDFNGRCKNYTGCDTALNSIKRAIKRNTK